MSFIPIEYRIIFIFAIIIAFLLTERRFSFDLKQRVIMFGSYLFTILVGLIIVYQLLKILLGYLPTP